MWASRVQGFFGLFCIEISDLVAYFYFMAYFDFMAYIETLALELRSGGSSNYTLV